MGVCKDLGELEQQSPRTLRGPICKLDPGSKESKSYTQGTETAETDLLSLSRLCRFKVSSLERTGTGKVGGDGGIRSVGG